jgi:hypothetical protein
MKHRGTGAVGTVPFSDETLSGGSVMGTQADKPTVSECVKLTLITRVSVESTSFNNDYYSLDLDFRSRCADHMHE